MPPTITATDVAHAADQLLVQDGMSAVTLRRIRAQLGRGSLQTIHRHLTAWRATQDTADREHFVIPRLDEVVRMAERQSLSTQAWITAAIEEKLRQDRLKRLQAVLATPSDWPRQRHDALRRLTIEAGTRSPTAPSEDEVLEALRSMAGGRGDRAALVRRLVLDGHPHDLYLVVQGARNLIALLDELIAHLPSSKPAALRVGMELRLDGQAMLSWISDNPAYANHN